MRQATVLTVLVVGLAATVALLVVPSLFGSPAAPTATWDTKDEIAVATADAVDPAEAALSPADQAREMLLAGADDEGLGERTKVLLRGRVVDRFHQPVREARIWLDFGRGGPRLERGPQPPPPGPEPAPAGAEARRRSPRLPWPDLPHPAHHADRRAPRARTEPLRAQPRRGAGRDGPRRTDGGGRRRADRPRHRPRRQRHPGGRSTAAARE